MGKVKASDCYHRRVEMSGKADRCQQDRTGYASQLNIVFFD